MAAFRRLRDESRVLNERPLTVQDIEDFAEDLDLDVRVWGRLCEVGQGEVARFSPGQRMAFLTREVESYVDGQGGLYEYFISGGRTESARMAIEGYRLIGQEEAADALRAALDLVLRVGLDGLGEVEDDLIDLEDALAPEGIAGQRVAYIRAHPAEFAG
jgi:hypothetical protein